MQSLGITKIGFVKMEKKSLDALEGYIKIYENYLKEVREETYKKFPEETAIIIEIINNWIDIIPRKEEDYEDYIHSFQGVLLFYLWKISNWIGYEILNGKYFEALRNCRFLFEASILSIIMEDAIESKVYEKWKSLSHFGLKCEILRLWEELRDKHIYKEEDKTDVIRKLVEEYLERSNLPEEEKKEYIEVYCSILSDERLGYNIPKMIEESKEFLPIEDKEKSLKDTWRALNKYAHFTYTFCDKVLERPDLVFIESMDEKLFKECFDIYFNTIDLFYCILCWRFQRVKEKMKEVIDWWNKNFSLRLELTEKMINSKEERQKISKKPGK
ncbi:MAG: hypothetical protein DSO07_12350 [Thermoproteota archaeon]|nr:MAG: hypothetical protein DSO07_12350 [Candidatus Korarchaeota archaeon]